MPKIPPSVETFLAFCRGRALEREYGILVLSPSLSVAQSVFLNWKVQILGPLVAHTCNPSYLRGWDWGPRPVLADRFRDTSSKITRAQWTGGVAQIQNPNPVPPKKKKKKIGGGGKRPEYSCRRKSIEKNKRCFDFFFSSTRAWTQGLIPWATPPAIFCVGFFWNRVSWTVCPGWLQTLILLISASWAARITGISHQLPVCLAPALFVFLRQDLAM
jgi:hypothetical protein